jgi:hypothetical protein
MKVAVMQPTFLPWVGYFDLIDRVDRFVFLDTVPFTRQSWQHRNRIKTAQGLQWITLPVVASVTDKTLIRDVRLGEVRSDKILRAIEQNYARAPFFASLWPRFLPLIERIEKEAPLAEINMAIITEICSLLGLTTPLLRAHDLPPCDGRIERLIALTAALGGDTYVSPMGAAGYLAEAPNAFAAANLTLSFQSYDHPSYPQRFPPFIPGCGIFDLVFNAGPDSLATIRAGRRPDKSADSVFAGLSSSAAAAEAAA